MTKPKLWKRLVDATPTRSGYYNVIDNIQRPIPYIGYWSRHFGTMCRNEDRFWITLPDAWWSEIAEVNDWLDS